MTKPLLSNLKSYIDDQDQHWEKECQQYLMHIPEFLCRETPRKILVRGREEASRYGYNDYCVSAIISDGIIERRMAYVWEVKAPQSHVFEFDDHAKRLRPTKDLIKAETQLFHYVEEFQQSKSFREWFKLDTLGMVVPAGIIIGSPQSLVKPSTKYGYDADELQKLFVISMYARNAHLYNKASIAIKTWDWVYECYSIETSALTPPGPSLI